MGNAIARITTLVMLSLPTDAHRHRLTVLLFTFCLCLLPRLSAAQDEVVLANGKTEYEQHCASCHGVSGTGSGPMAAFLTIKPTNLTQLSQKHGGRFPFWHTYSVIDGREEVMAHGSRRMPVWGSEFLIEEGDHARDEDRVLGRILALVYFIQSIQEKS